MSPFIFLFCVYKQDLVLYNTSKQDVKWMLDISNTGKLFKDGTFKISVLGGVLQSHKEFKVTISFCPSKYSLPIFAIDVSLYPSHTIYFYHVHNSLGYFLCVLETVLRSFLLDFFHNQPQYGPQ